MYHANHEQQAHVSGSGAGSCSSARRDEKGSGLVPRNVFHFVFWGRTALYPLSYGDGGGNYVSSVWYFFIRFAPVPRNSREEKGVDDAKPF